jgi:hypothetical protein
VIDTGYKKEKEYVHRTSGAIEQLRKRPVSKAAAWQRTGRAGREVSCSWAGRGIREANLSSGMESVSDYSQEKLLIDLSILTHQRYNGVISLRQCCNW